MKIRIRNKVLGARQRGTTLFDSKKIGRNQPCPCESGIKRCGRP